MELQRVPRNRSSLVPILVLLALALSSLPAAAAVAERCAVVQPRPLSVSLIGVGMCPNCDCYYSSECTSTQKCDYASGCTKNGKLDGTCTAKTASTELASVEQVTAALTYWFDAYVATAISGKDGLPDALLVDRTRQLGLSAEAEAALRDQVIDSLDVLLGFDVTLPRGNCLEQDFRCLANLRIPIEEEGSALLQAAKEGLVKAVESGDPKPVYENLDGFWRFGDYHPHHTGRCYPHGHAGHEEVPPVVCQKDELGRIAEYLISIAGPR